MQKNLSQAQHLGDCLAKTTVMQQQKDSFLAHKFSIAKICDLKT